MLFSVCGVIIFIIIFTSVFCIRNSFAISITEKMKMYGMLASVGATKKQIKKSVIDEAMILRTYPEYPFGIISGIFAIFVLLKIISAILGEFLFEGINRNTIWSKHLVNNFIFSFRICNNIFISICI